ncbi:MAG: hypothetical protein IPM33_02815 [Phycisphaerales bacterium]|nr:hypothetical protein [Phycisphaerales bacterium]
MNDRELQALLTFALEAEAFERDALRPASIPIWRRPWVWGGLAAAAALAIAIPMLIPAPAPAFDPSNEARVQPVAARTLSDDDLNAIQRALGEMLSDPMKVEGNLAMVIAIVRGDQGECECVHWRRHQLPAGKALADLSRNELLRLGMQDSCPASTDRLLVVGVACDEIPLDGRLAGQLAACVDVGETCGDTATCYASRALACLPDDATVVAATLAMSR